VPEEDTRIFFQQVVLGLHIVRGDNVALVGELDEEVDKRMDLSALRAEPLQSLVK
jgi:U6 snRNA-associated Sm-like protein LSm8